MTTTALREAPCRTCHWLARLAGVAAMLALLPACRPEPPDRERPPEPQAVELRDAIQAPIDRARQVEIDVEKAAEAQREAIDAASGG